MSGHSDLTAEDAVRSDLGGAGHTRLRGDDRIVADDDIVRHHDEVVEFDAMLNLGAAHCRAVDASVRPDLDIVLDDDYSDLLNLVVDTILVGCETEAVGTNYDARVEHATRTDFASLVDLDARVNDSSLADGDPVANVSLGIDFGAVSHFRLVAYVGEGSYVDILADRGVGADERRLLDSSLRLR